MDLSCLASFALHHVYEVHPSCTMYQYVIHFHGCIILHCMSTHNFFIHLSLFGKFFCNQYLAIVNNVAWIFLFFSFVFFGCTCSMQKFPGQGLNTCHSCNQSYSMDNTGSLIHCATRELCYEHFWISIWVSVFISIGHIPRNGIAGSFGNSCCNFPETTKLFSITVAPFYILPIKSRRFLFIPILTNCHINNIKVFLLEWSGILSWSWFRFL